MQISSQNFFLLTSKNIISIESYMKCKEFQKVPDNQNLSWFLCLKYTCIELNRISSCSVRVNYTLNQKKKMNNEEFLIQCLSLNIDG